MAVKQMKRPAAAAGGASMSPKKRSKHGSDVTSKCDSIKASLAEAEHLSEPVRHLLINGVVDSLGVLKSQRHEFQSSITRMIGETLESILKKKEEAVNAKHAKVSNALKEEHDLASIKTTAEVKLAELHYGVEMAKTAHAGVVQELEDAMRAVKEAKADQKDGDTSANAASALKESLERWQAKLAELKEVAADKKTISELVSACRKAKFDEALLDMVPGVLKKSIGERGTFDSMALMQLDNEFKAHLDKLAAQLKDPEADKAARAAAVDTATTAEEAAKKKRDDAADAVNEASTASKEGKSALSAAVGRIAHFLEEKDGFTEAMEDAKMSLSKHQIVLVAYRDLLELAPLPEPVEEKLVEEKLAPEMTWTNRGSLVIAEVAPAAVEVAAA